MTLNGSGQEVNRYYYRPFGEQLDVSLNPLGLQTLRPTQYGYTGHEHVKDLDIINMGGRIYAAGLRRFLQADPVVGHPMYSQSYNPYQYVYGNPMVNVDPSGYNTQIGGRPGSITNINGDAGQGMDSDHTQSVSGYRGVDNTLGVNLEEQCQEQWREQIHIEEGSPKFRKDFTTAVDDLCQYTEFQKIINEMYNKQLKVQIIEADMGATYEGVDNKVSRIYLSMNYFSETFKADMEKQFENFYENSETYTDEQYFKKEGELITLSEKSKFSVQRVIVHEFSHVVDEGSPLDSRPNFEQRAVDFTNAFMSKYYGEPHRRGYQARASTPYGMRNYAND
ncbi:RHS repeat-associated core domain-containing protein [Motilimonas sp. E26]|uniref:RHS repeat domain-containing protein n=1 Tax=Motilimonas sp. E26 TaxID=2865674 RepID=UPI001E47DA5D|nr:RHS repeat-associated core domain-containing protein [Motilimonas sp. E26]